MKFPRKYENGESFKQELFDLAKSLFNKGESIATIKDAIKNELFQDTKDLDSGFKEKINKELDSYINSFEYLFGSILEEFEGKDTNKLEEELKNNQYKLKKDTVLLSKITQNNVEKNSELDLAKKSVNSIKKQQSSIATEENRDINHYSESAIKNRFVLSLIETLDAVSNTLEILNKEKERLESSIDNSLAPNAKKLVLEKISDEADKIDEQLKKSKKITKLLNDEGNNLSSEGEKSKEFLGYIKTENDDKERRSGLREKNSKTLESDLKISNVNVEKLEEEIKTLTNQINKLKDQNQTLEKECLMQSRTIKDISKEILESENIQDAFTELVKEYKKLRNRYKKLDALENFEDTFSVPVLDEAVKGLGEKIKGKKFINISNNIISVFSGVASAFGLSQTLPKVFYDAELFLDSTGTSVDQTAVWTTAGLVGVGVGVAAGKFRDKILKGTESGAKNLKNNVVTSILKGTSKELLGFDVEKKSFSPSRLLLGVALIGATLGSVKPSKDAWKNFPSVPSDALGMFTYAYGDRVQDGAKEKVLGLSTQVKNSVDSIQNNFKDSEKKTIAALEQYISDEINGTGINGNAGFGNFAKAKSFAIDGKLSRDGYGNFSVRPDLLSLLKSKGISADNGLTQKLIEMNVEQDSIILQEIQKVSPALVNQKLTEILKGGKINLLTAAINLNEYKLTFAQNVDSLILKINQRNTLNKNYTDVVTDVLGGIDKKSAAESGKQFDASFLPKTEKIDVSKIKDLKEKIVKQIDGLSPFISDLDAASAIISPNNAELLSGLFILCALLIELGVLLYGLPMIHKNTKRKYGEIYSDLYPDYKNLIDTQKSKGNIPTDQTTLSENKLFSTGLESFVEEIEKILSQVVLGSLYQVGAFSENYTPSKNDEKILLPKIRQAIQNTYKPSSTSNNQSNDLLTKIASIFKTNANKEELTEKELLAYVKNLVINSDELNSVIKELSLGNINFESNNLEWLDLTEESSNEIHTNITTYNAENSDYPLKKK